MKRIISLGGSLIYPKDLDKEFVGIFVSLIESYVDKGDSFVIFCGGGRLARDMQEAAGDVSDHEKDLIGIKATKKNAEFVQSQFNEDLVYEEVVKDPTKELSTEKGVVVCSGWKPGWSTDTDAVLMAKNVGAKIIINMSNISHVYDKDPKEYPDAKKCDTISWKDFRKLVGDEWSPGLSMPFDPIASKEAEKNSFQVVIIGNDLDNLKNVLDNKEFEGTTIK